MSYTRKGNYYIEGEWGGRECICCGWFRYWSEFSNTSDGFMNKNAKCKSCHNNIARRKILNNKSITQSYLKSIIKYDRDSGIFIWKKQISNRIKVGDVVGKLGKRGYYTTSINGVQYYLHRLAWLYIYGEFPKNELDHINRIRTDNRILNLREVIHAKNMKNNSIPSINTSGIMGVYWAKDKNKWTSQIRINSSSKYLGRYSSKLNAAKARRKAEIKYGYAEWLTNSTALSYILKHEADYIDE